MGEMSCAPYRIINMSRHIENHRLHGMIVEPDPGCRDRLRQAAAASDRFEEMFQGSDLDDVLFRLKDGETFDLIFVSGRFPRDELNYFLHRAKETYGARDAAFILVGERLVAGALDVASELLAGFDGVLFEPFSVDGLSEVTKLSTRVKAERSRCREKAAIDLLVREVIVQIGELARVKQSGYEGSITKRVLKELHDVLEDLTPEAREYYFESMVRQFSALHAPRPPLYAGVSARIRTGVQKQLELRSMKALDMLNRFGRAAGNG